MSPTPRQPPVPPPPSEPTIDGTIFEGKPKISEHAKIAWVLDNLDVKVEIDDAPSAGAWSLLQHARLNQYNRAEFLRNFATKLIPPKSKLDQDGRHEDDGREQLRVLSVVENELRKELGKSCPTCGTVLKGGSNGNGG